MEHEEKISLTCANQLTELKRMRFKSAPSEFEYKIFSSCFSEDGSVVNIKSLHIIRAWIAFKPGRRKYMYMNKTRPLSLLAR